MKKVKIGKTEEHVEIGHYRKFEADEDKPSAFRGSFSVVFHPHGQKILECKHYEKEGAHWFNFPQKEIKNNEGKRDYIPYVSYIDKDYGSAVKAAITKCIKDIKDGDYAQPNKYQPTSNENDASFSFDSPFV